MLLRQRLVFRLICCTALITLVTAPGFAAAPVISSGIDVWHTSEDGSSFTDLSQNPIPADFFCSGSKSFAGRIHFKGGPLATEPPGALEGIDTVIQRLDDAVFDDTGVARTRLQVKALSLIGVEPLDVGCGRFEVAATLAGDQPITEMTILREGEHGGTYLAPLSLAVRLTFTPLDRDAPPLELIQNISLEAIPDAPWSTTTGPGHVRREGFIVVDTDGDRTPDLNLPGTTRGFVAGREAPGKRDLDLLIRNVDVDGFGARSVDSPSLEKPATENGDLGGLRLATGALNGGEPYQCCFDAAGNPGCWWNVCHCTPLPVNGVPTDPNEGEETTENDPDADPAGPTPLENCRSCKHYHCVVRWAECANICSTPLDPSVTVIVVVP